MENYIFNTCRIICGKKCGTGVLIAPNKVMTATHVLSYCDTAPITIMLESTPDCKTCTGHWSPSVESPIAILTLEEDVAYQRMLFLSRELCAGERATAYGFPVALSSGYNLSMQINNIQLAGSHSAIDANITLDPLSKVPSYRGMSGATLVVDGEVAGMLLTEHVAASNAYIICALAGTDFRQALRANGFEPVVGETSVVFSKQEPSQAIGRLTNECRLLHSELNLIYTKELTSLANMRISGKRADAWVQLKHAIDNAKSSSVSREAKASYYYLAAIWSLEDDTGEADAYFQEACSINSSLDTRVFCSAQAFKAGRSDEAFELLGEIDSIEILNERVKLLYQSDKQTEAIAEYQSYPNFTQNDFSWELLALCNMELGNYEDAHVFVDKLITRYPAAPSTLFLKGQIYWGQALSSYRPQITHNLFLLVNPAHFLPNIEQQEHLTKAYNYYVKAIDSAEESLPTDREWYLANLVSVCAILLGKDTVQWLRKLELESQLSSLAIIIRIVLGFDIPTAQSDAFLAQGQSGPVSFGFLYAKYLLLVRLERIVEAKQLLSLYGDKIADSSYIPKTILQFELSLRLKDWHEARALAKQLDDDNQQKRMLLAVDAKEGYLKASELKKRVFSLAEETRAPLDYCNAYGYCRKQRDWHGCVKAAKGWYRVEPELAVLMSEAEALLYYHRENKAYALIEKLEKAGHSGKALLRLKAKCLWGLSKRDEVVALLDSFQFEEDDSELLLLKAQICVEQGSNNAAIRCLKDYVDRGYKDKSVMSMLVSLLKVESLPEAFAYAKKQYEAYPDDKQILMGAHHLGLLVGEGDLSDEWFALTSGIENNTPYIKSCTTEEILKIIEDNRKNADDWRKKYIDMELPLSTFMDLRSNTTMGEMLYRQWKNGDVGAAFIASGTGVSDTVLPDGASVILDYSACVTAIELDILAEACSRWKCYISPLLMPAISREIAKLNSVQKSRVEDAQAHKSAISTHGLTILKMPDELEGNIFDLQAFAAVKYSYCIVADDLLEDLKKNIPDGWNEHRISHQQFISYLKYLGICSDATVDAAIPAYLKNNTPKGFLLDSEILTDLFNDGILQLAIDAMPMAVLAEQVSTAHSDVREFDTQKKAAIWLKTSVHATLAEKISSNAIHILPQAEKSKRDDDRFPLNTLLVHELNSMSKCSYSLWYDDKFSGRFARSDSRFVGFSNILHSLYSQDEGSLYKRIDRLFSCHIGNFLPATPYLENRLLLCRYDAGQAMLLESTTLKNVRQTISFTLLPHSLSNEVNIPANGSERKLYLANLRELVCQLLFELWNSNAELVQILAMASWVMNNLVSLVYDGEQDDDSLLYMQTWQVLIGVFLEPDRKQDYYDWLNSFLEPSWNASPDDEASVAQSLVRCLFATGDIDTILTNLQALADCFPILSFLHEVFSQPIVIKNIEFSSTLHLEPRINHNSQPEVIDESIIEDAIKGVNTAEAAVLDAVYQSPATATHLVQYLEDAAWRRRVNASYKFLSTLYWCVPRHEKPRVKSLFSWGEYWDVYADK